MIVAVVGDRDQRSRHEDGREGDRWVVGREELAPATESLRHTYRVMDIHLVTGFGFPLADGGPVLHADLQLSDVLLHGCSYHTPHQKGAE